MLLVLEPDDDCIGRANGGAHGPDELPEVPWDINFQQADAGVVPSLSLVKLS